MSNSALRDTLSWAALILCALIPPGCSGRGDSEVSVEGTVTLDGSPLPAAYLTLEPLEKRPGMKGAFVGKSDDEGRFSLGPVGKPNGGVPAGNYRLFVTTAHGENAGDEGAVMPPERIPLAARARTLEVPQGGLPDLKLDLTSK